MKVSLDCGWVWGDERNLNPANLVLLVLNTTISQWNKRRKKVEAIIVVMVVDLLEHMASEEMSQ